MRGRSGVQQLTTLHVLSGHERLQFEDKERTDYYFKWVEIEESVCNGHMPYISVVHNENKGHTYT